MKFVDFDEWRQKAIISKTWDVRQEEKLWQALLSLKEAARADWSRVDGKSKDHQTVAMLEQLNMVFANYEVYRNDQNRMMLKI